jgi:hypothetical protein
MSDTHNDTAQERKPLEKRIYCIRQVEKISYEYEIDAVSWKDAMEKFEDCPEAEDGSHCYEGSYAPTKLGWYTVRTCSLDNGAWMHSQNPCMGAGSVYARDYDEDLGRHFFRHSKLVDGHGWVCQYCEREMSNKGE